MTTSLELALTANTTESCQQTINALTWRVHDLCKQQAIAYTRQTAAAIEETCNLLVKAYARMDTVKQEKTK